MRRPLLTALLLATMLGGCSHLDRVEGVEMPARFSHDGGFALDKATDLLWQGELPTTIASCTPSPTDVLPTAPNVVLGTATPCTYEKAYLYCRDGKWLGATWRLPTKAELETLVDMAEIESTQASLAVSGYNLSNPRAPFWTGETQPGRAGYGYAVCFCDGRSALYPLNSMLRVRCVRD